MLTLLIGGAPIICGCAEMHVKAQETRDYSAIPVENNEPVDGMFFSVENVTEYCEYTVEDPGYGFNAIGGCVYDCPDANLDNAEILVSWKSYVEMDDFIRNGQDMYGYIQHLYTLEDGTPVYAINWEE